MLNVQSTSTNQTTHPQVVIGDSIMAGREAMWGPPQISGRLEELSGQKIENHAIIGASLHECVLGLSNWYCVRVGWMANKQSSVCTHDRGWVKSIPQLYAELDKQTNGPVTTCIMNGGGNDVITFRDDCVKFNDACKYQIDGAMAIAGELLDKMQQEGVQHVLYLGFYKVRSTIQRVLGISGGMLLDPIRFQDPPTSQSTKPHPPNQSTPV